jgi:hypothetical protein
MRAALAVLAPIVIALPAIAAEAPFVPPGVTPPDYVAAITEKDGFGKTRNWTIMHHGDWSRASFGFERGGYAEYLATNDSVRITDSANYIGFSRPARYDRTTDYEPHNTGERQTHLGENCTVWEIERTRPGQIGSVAVTRLSCVTDDGIELWRKQVSQYSSSSQEVTRLDRRPVTADDTAPPPRLALDWWDKYAPAPAASDIPDHEVVMKLPEGNALAAMSVRTRHRSGQWERIDEILGARRHIRITDEPSGFYFAFWTDNDGGPTDLSITRLDKPADPSELAKAQSQPKALDRKEAVLGESCDWFNLTPDVSDASTTECLAHDRITLKELFAGRASRIEWTAVSVTRRPVKLEEMKPPVELLDPQTWLAR